MMNIRIKTTSTAHNIPFYRDKIGFSLITVGTQYCLYWKENISKKLACEIFRKYIKHKDVASISVSKYENSVSKYENGE